MSASSVGVTASTTRALGGPGWLVAASGSGAQAVADGGLTGPVQPMGSSGDVGPGPFSLSWPGAGGPTTAWLSVPAQSAEGVPSALRLPIRWQDRPPVVTLLLGTSGGSGSVQITGYAGAGAAGRAARLELPACREVCPIEATLTLAGPAGPGEVVVDITAAPGATVGLAGVVRR